MNIMSLFSIDTEKCANDGICAAECPVRIINIANGVPEPMPDAETLCIRCGHCVAVCPTAAFSLKAISPGQCLEINPDLSLSPGQAEQFLRSRRSIRQYRKKTVEKETLEHLITLASHAPSGHNRQPANWHVIYDRAEIETLAALVIDWMRYMMAEHPEPSAALHLDRVVAGWEAGIDSITRGTPHLILVHGDKKDPSAQPACTIAMTYLELAIHSLGLGGCWCGYFNAAANLWPPLQEALALPKGHAGYGAMMVGYPRFTYHRMPPRNAPRITWR